MKTAPGQARVVLFSNESYKFGDGAASIHAIIFKAPDPGKYLTIAFTEDILNAEPACQPSKGSMYGDMGLKLVQYAKRSQSLAHLPPYQSELVRAITREVRDLDRDVTETLEPFGGQFDPSNDPALATLLLANHICIRRNKRCLLAYHRSRVEKIEEMCWSGSDILEQVQIAKGEGGEGEGVLAAAEGGNVSSLSPEEEEYARQYSDLLAAYKGQWTDIDLTGSLDPPRDLFIDVRVLKDAGEIQTEYGAINLTKNSQFFVRQGDVERLIAQGFLQKLN